MGLADPHEMAAEVFSLLDERRDHGLHDLYKAIDRVVVSSYQRYADQFSVLERLRGGLGSGSNRRTPIDDFLVALSNLRRADRELLQLRFWDDLDEAEAAEVLGLTREQTRLRMANAGTKYLAKLAKRHPDLSLSDVVDTIRSIKPGIYRRFGMG